jgi:hypothetical protein
MQRQQMLLARMAVTCRGRFLPFDKALFTLGLIVTQLPENRFTAVAPLLCAFSPTILIMTALIMMSQALMATGAYAGLALDVVLFNSIGVLASYLSLSLFGVYGLVAGDLFATACGVALLVLRLQRSKQNAAPLTVEQRP